MNTPTAPVEDRPMHAVRDASPTPTEGPDRVHRHLPAWRRLIGLMRFEFRLLTKQRTTVIMTLAAPAFLLAFPLLSEPGSEAEWLALLPPMSVLVLLVSSYVTTATTITNRRENQVFKRLRTTELTRTQMLTGLLAPLALIGVGQVMAVIGGYRLLGAPPPTNPGLLAAAVLATTLLSVVAGVTTATFAANNERVQLVSFPLLLIGAIAANVLMNPAAGDDRWLVLLAPFAACADLIARGLGAPPQLLAQVPVAVAPVIVDLGLIAAWGLAFALLAVRRWKWEPRS